MVTFKLFSLVFFKHQTAVLQVVAD